MAAKKTPVGKRRFNYKEPRKNGFGTAKWYKTRCNSLTRTNRQFLNKLTVSAQQFAALSSKMNMMEAEWRSAKEQQFQAVRENLDLAYRVHVVSLIANGHSMAAIVNFLKGPEPVTVAMQIASTVNQDSSGQMACDASVGHNPNMCNCTSGRQHSAESARTSWHPKGSPGCTMYPSGGWTAEVRDGKILAKPRT